MARKSTLAGAIALVCATALGATVPLFGAYAEGNIPIALPNAQISTEDVGEFTLYNATWNISGNDVTLQFPNFVGMENGEITSFQSVDDIIHGFEASYEGNFCDDYSATLTANDGASERLTCLYQPADEYGGNISNLRLPDNPNLPGNVTSFTLSVTASGEQPPQPSQMYEVKYDNVVDVDSDDDGSYAVVAPQGTDEQFRIYSDDTDDIGCFGDEQSMNCGIELEWNVFSQASFRISNNYDPDTMVVMLHGANNYSQQLAAENVGNYYVVGFNGLNLPADSYGVNLGIELKDQGPGPDDPDTPQPHPGVPTNATVTIAGTDTSKSFYRSRIEINDTPIIEDESCEMDATSCPATYTNDHFTYNKEENVNTVEIRFATLFIHKFINSVKVNNQTYQIPFDYTNRQEWLAHYDHQMISFVLNVDASDRYDIVVDVAETPSEQQYIANFLWTNSEDERYDHEGRQNDDYIGHSNIELVSILCHVTEDHADDVLITSETDEIPEGCIIEYDPGSEEHPVGSLVLPNDSIVTIRLKTEYGWQVTSFGANGSEIAVDPDKVAEYTFNVHQGNFHLGAVVEEVEDEVNASSKKVKSGTISLGGEEIVEGTAMLTVDDAELSDEEKDAFREQAGDYNISTFLEINLDQIFYDGHDGYWKGAAMNELANEATITLKLEEGVDGNEVVLVHKKHDGTYEIIPTVYDPATNTITFKTSSFSDYAIASKVVAEKDDTEAPKTFDDVIRYLVMFALSGLGMVAVGIFGLKAIKEEE